MPAPMKFGVFLPPHHVPVGQNPTYSLQRDVELVKLLDTMALVNVEPSDDGPVFSLRATPEEHMRIQGPDKKPRWVFIARPVEPRDVDPSSLN